MLDAARVIVTDAALAYSNECEIETLTARKTCGAGDVDEKDGISTARRRRDIALFQ
jgi:hypothetical protein